MTTIETIETMLVDQSSWFVPINNIPKREKKPFVSKELYWTEYYEHPYFNYEWNNGCLEEKPMASAVEFAMYLWFVKILQQYLEHHQVAIPVGLETAFEVVLPNKTTIRKPDFGLVLHSNPVPMRDKDRRYYGIFDICIEAVSASNRNAIERDTVDKVSEYELAGVQEYYILDERGIETTFLHNVNGVYQLIQPVNDVIQSTVLPGFQFRLDDLYTRPSLIELAHDPVYQGFILPEYKQAQNEAKLAQKQVEQERQAKEKLATKLRELGIDPDSIE
jgi:Uma2 family endonuclease